MKKSLLVVFTFCLLLAGCSSISGAPVEQATQATYNRPSHSVASQGCQAFRDQLAEQLFYAHTMRADLDDAATLDQSEEAAVRSTMRNLQHQISQVQTELNDCLKRGN